MSRKPTPKPSERRNFEATPMELNITPMMNLIAILIPVLLVSTVFVEIATVDVNLPGDGCDGPCPEPPEAVPLELAVTVTHRGYVVRGNSPEILGQADPGGFKIPLVERPTSCGSFMATVPPPRARNVGSGPCLDPAEERVFWTYDQRALGDLLSQLKDRHPKETSVTIGGDPDIEFETIIGVMDTAREQVEFVEQSQKKEVSPLFPHVRLRGLYQGG